MSKLYRESPVVFRIRPDDEISETCIHLEEFMSSAARNSKNALKVIDRMNGSGKTKDTDLLTALKKYVEDTCEAIKKVDSTLKDNNSGLQSLLIEIPNETSEDEVSWRSLVTRRDVIAHGLLTVDDDRVYMEAVRDFDWSCPDLVDSQWFDMLNARSIPPLKGNWGIVVDGGVATVGVVPALDVLEDGHASLSMGLEGPAIQEFTLQRGEEALA